MLKLFQVDVTTSIPQPLKRIATFIVPADFVEEAEEMVKHHYNSDCDVNGFLLTDDLTVPGTYKIDIKF